MNKDQLKDLIREEVQSHLSEQQNEIFVSDLEDIKSKFSRTANKAIDYIVNNNVDTKGEL